jgi:hypothetical protein
MSHNTRNIKNCDGNHNVCTNMVSILEKSLNDNENIEISSIKTFFELIFQQTNYSYSCLSSYYNKNYHKLVLFIEKINNKDIIIEPLYFAKYCQFVDDKLGLNIITNQTKLDKDYCNKLLLEKNVKSQYGSNISFITICINNSKINIINYAIENMSFTTFSEIITSLKMINDKCIDSLIKFINKHSNLLDNKILINLVDNFTNKSQIIKLIYNIISKSNSDLSLKKILLEKSVKTFNKELIITILEETNENLLTKELLTLLINQNYFREIYGSCNNKQTAEIIDIFILYGFKITNELVIELLNKGCYINNIGKYNIEINNDILEKCAELNYYPYEFDCIPSNKVLMIECNKSNNLDRIKMFKEKGGIFTKICLENACAVKKNGKVIKFLINECGIKPDENCLKSFQDIHGMEALDILMKNYDTDIKKEIKVETKIDIDTNSLVSIDKRDFEIDLEYNYNIRNKIRKLLEYKKKLITFKELEELILKYLINKKLVIGHYFILNNELASIIKINQGTLMNIDEVKNIVTYFIEK